MAAIVYHVLRKTGHQFFTNINGARFASSKKNKFIAKTSSRTSTGPRIDSIVESIASKGFLRPHKPYVPSENIPEQVQQICQQYNLNIKNNQKFTNLKEKITVLVKCYESFRHGIPNSQLHEIECIDDIIEFYKTPVTTTLPLDNIISQELPQNLHIIKDAHRFHPETDSLFNGKTAFPKSSTLVTGLKYKKKYRGHIAKSSWP